MMPKQEKVKYVYFSLISDEFKKNNKIQGGVATVAYKYYPELKKLEMGIAFCNPNDRFEKKIGRQIAYARMNNKYHCFTINDVKDDNNIEKLHIEPIINFEDIWPLWAINNTNPYFYFRNNVNKN